MTEVAFHFNAPEKLGYACRLLRKAVGGGARVVVTGDGALLGELDTQLWTFSALDFLPHCRATGVSASVLQRSPIVLAESATDVPHTDVLVNLGVEVPDGFDAFARLIDVVTGDEDDRQQARRRWKHYADRGYAIVRHDLAEAR
jgi:DNA polymerase-3 subunit chi